MIKRFGRIVFGCLASALVGLMLVARAQTTSSQTQPIETRVVYTWFRLALELTRHTATYMPPVAARTFGYLGVALFETTAAQSSQLRSLTGQLNGFEGVPQPVKGVQYDRATVTNAALSSLVKRLYANTGPSGQRVLEITDSRTQKELEARNLPADVMERSKKYGQSVADAIYAWAQTDGGASVTNMGFPLSWPKPKDASGWLPTTTGGEFQAPLLPDWGKNRPFVLKSGEECPPAPHPPYSEKPDSAFYAEALEVYRTTKAITPAQRTIARFWTDDAMLSYTPPGHWVAILTNILEAKNANLETISEVYARLGIAVADAFIGCWNAKYKDNLLRPITYIRRVIDPKWETVLTTTPPFPEFPSGHSVQSGAAATVLSATLGDKFGFTDTSTEPDGLEARTFASFWDAAREAAISRLYGGIHFRSAIQNGLEQGRCIGMKVNALKFRR
jgi:membrane-associated phospholipid phosphatase